MTLDEMRTLVWGHLRTLINHPAPTNLQIRAFEVAVVNAARQRGLMMHLMGQDTLQGYDSVHLRAVVAELVTAGVLVWGIDCGHQAAPPWLQLTEFGLECAREGRVSPYDHGGYLSQVDRQVPQLDAVAREYLVEALVCLQRACYRACAVMLGGASETVMLRLIERFRDVLQNPARQAAFINGAIEPLSIARRVRFFRNELETTRLTIPQPLRDNLPTQLDGIFTLIRVERNDAGHPNAVATTRDTAHANLLLFPSYCTAAHELMDHLRANPIP